MNKLGYILLGYALYKVVTSVKRISVGMQSIRLTGIENGRLLLRANLIVYNPTIASVMLQTVMGDLYIQGIKCGYVSQNYTNGKVRANSSTVIPVDVLVNMSQLTNSIVENIKTGDVSTLTIRFAGEASVSGVRVPIDINLNWEDLNV